MIRLSDLKLEDSRVTSGVSHQCKIVFSMLSWVLRDNRNIYFSKTTLLFTAVTPFYIREGFKNVVLGVLAEAPLTPIPMLSDNIVVFVHFWPL